VGKIKLLKELWGFLRIRKKYWLLPVFFVLILVSFLVILTEGSSLAPFIYALF